MRRKSWRVLAGCAFLLAGARLAGQEGGGTAGSTAVPHVNEQRLWDTLQKLAEFGKNPEGGVSRVGFTEADLAGREYVTGLMREAGLDVHVDPAGNIFGRRAGTANVAPLLLGSHTDSVPHGGNYDGDVGTLGALEVVRALNEAHITTRHPLEVVDWANEEGGRYYSGLFGSSAAAGILPKDVAERRDEKGDKLAGWLSKMGGDGAKIGDARIAPGTFAGYLELHIEQGGNLDEQKIPIGVVLGIVGISARTCTATGFANHAGTTPMDRRRDALAAASRAVLAVREEVRSEPGRQVGTVGWMKVEPGAMNVIPGRVTFPVELRDLDEKKVERIGARVLQRFQQIGRQENVEITCTEPDVHAPALTNPAFQAAIRASAKEVGLATLDLPSGAGHDAQNAAKFTSIGMIFVPSRGGISHSPLEYTSAQDAANGAEVLYRTLLKLDEQLNAGGAAQDKKN